jgi:hypothetical protein
MPGFDPGRSLDQQFAIGAAELQQMEAEQPCPYCKQVHYSSYNAERCAARHDSEEGLKKFMKEQKGKKQEQKPLQPGKKKCSPLFE